MRNTLYFIGLSAVLFPAVLLKMLHLRKKNIPVNKNNSSNVTSKSQTPSVQTPGKTGYSERSWGRVLYHKYC